MRRIESSTAISFITVTDINMLSQQKDNKMQASPSFCRLHSTPSGSRLRYLRCKTNSDDEGTKAMTTEWTLVIPNPHVWVLWGVLWTPLNYKQKLRDVRGGRPSRSNFKLVKLKACKWRSDFCMQSMTSMKNYSQGHTLHEQRVACQNKRPDFTCVWKPLRKKADKTKHKSFPSWRTSRHNCFKTCNSTSLWQHVSSLWESLLLF